MTDPTGRPSPFVGCPDRPVFIGAAPRSGTTLLRLMLNASPDLALPRETTVLVQAWEERRKYGDLRKVDNRRKFADWVVSLQSPSYRRFGWGKKDLHQKIVEAPPTLGSLVGTCFLAYAEKSGKPRWGDKRPIYARYLDAVFSMFPDAQFIHLVRDPRAACASMARIWYADNEGPVGPAVELWQRSMRAVDPWREHLGPDQFLELRYEQFVADPTATLEQVASFVQMSPGGVEAMLRYHESPDENSPVHRDALKPPTTANIDAWRSVLELDEIAFIEHMTAPFMDHYGYEPVASGTEPSPAARRSYRRRRAWRKSEREQCVRNELRALLHPGRPVRARLTDAQARGAKPTSFPRHRKRWIGRPP